MAAQSPMQVPAADAPDMSVDVKQPIPVAAPAAQATLPPLPAGWFEMKDPSGRTMFFNSANGTTSWQRPMVRQLPPGWVKAQTPDGKPFYVHAATQQCSFQFPTAPAPTAQSTAPAAAHPSAKPHLTRITSTPTKPAQQPALVPGNPTIRRSATTPIPTTTTTTTHATTPKDPAFRTITANTTIARKSIPGFNEALAIHQLSQRNNSTVLTKKLGSDVAHASSALKDTTITAASLATRQAKAVGQTMVSKTKMQKVSKKAIVQTGALGVKLGRASKGLMMEMVDAADGKGRYGERKKVRGFVPQDPLPEVVGQGQGKRVEVVREVEVHAYEHEQAVAGEATQEAQQVQQVQQVAIPPKPMNTGVPVRKPVKRPSVSVEASFNPGTQASSTHAEMTETTAAVTEAQLTTLSGTTAEKPPRPAMGVNASVEISTQATLNLNMATSGEKPQLQSPPAMATSPPQPSTQPEQVIHQQSASLPQQMQFMQYQSQSTTPAPVLQVQMDASANVSLAHQTQNMGSPAPPPYSPQMTAAPTQPTTVVPAQWQLQHQQPQAMASPPLIQQQTLQLQQPQYVIADPVVQQPQYVILDPASQQQQQQQQQPIIIQQQQQDSAADAIFQASNMMALQQQMQALQMQQQFQQIQSAPQQQVVEQPVYQQQQFMEPQPAYQQQTVEQPVYQQAMVQPQTTAGQEEVYFVDESAITVTDVGASNGGTAVYQQEQQVAYADENGNVMYAQETTTEVYAADGEVVFMDDTVVYGEEYAVEDDGVDVGEFEEVECEEVDCEVECDIDC